VKVLPSLPGIPTWIQTRAAPTPLDARVLAGRLDPGETEAIALALDAGIGRVILDDLPARRLALQLGLRVIGTAGVLLLAKQRGIVPALRPLLDALKASGFRLRKDVHDEVLNAAGESEADT
jgi:predicted nucleic acid-binding protein